VHPLSKKRSNPVGREPRPFTRESVPCPACGQPKRETHAFCFVCFCSLPPRMQYALCDGDAAVRTFARADAQHWLETKLCIGRGPERPAWLAPVGTVSSGYLRELDRHGKGGGTVDRKTVSAGQ
jgi:hypothetical protein